MSVASSRSVRTSRPFAGRKSRLAIGLLSVAMAGACADESATAPSPDARLLEAGWSFGFCLGPCRGVLSLEGDDLEYQVTDRTGEQVLAETRGALSPSGSTRLGTLLAALPTELLAQYGCPDCADAGAAWVVVDRGRSGQRSDYEYPSPPRELAALDAFLREVMESLGGCRPSADVSVAGACVPLER